MLSHPFIAWAGRIALALGVAAIVHADDALPAPHPGPVVSTADLRGAYFVIGSKLASEVVRVEAAEWQRSPDGRTTFSRIEGTRLDGRSVVYERRLCDDGAPVSVREAGLVIDENGMLTRPGERPVMWDFSHPCGLTTVKGCESMGCSNCNVKADCACLEGGGSCFTKETRWCDGDCDANRICNTSVNDCRCVPIGDPPPASPSEDPGKQDPKMKTLAPR